MLPRGRAVAALVAIALPGAAAACGQATSVPVSTRPAAASVPAAARPTLRCPVTNTPIEPRRAAVARFRGRWVYLADDAARRKFEADPYEYADAVQAQWRDNRPLRVQVLCPVSGQPVDNEIYVGQGDDAIAFASEQAKAAWQQDRRRFERRLEEECYSFQTACATCGMPINPAVSRKLDDQVVYFCCAGCALEYEKNPADHRERLNEQIRANRTAWDDLHRPARPTGQPPPQTAPTSDR